MPAAFEAESVKCTSAGATILDSNVPATVESFTLSGLKVRDHVYCVVRNQLQALDGQGGQAVGRRPQLDHHLRRRYRRVAVRRLDGRDRERSERLLRLPGLDRSEGRRDPGAGRLHGHDPVRRQGPRRPTTAVRSRSRPRPRTAPPSRARSRTSRIARPSRWSSSGWAPPASATIFVDRNGSSPFDASTVATASGQSTSFTYPTSTPVTVGEVAVPAGYSATIQCGQGAAQPYTGGPFAVTRAGPAGCDAHLHDHEQAEALDGAGREAVGRRAFVDHDLRRPGRRGSVPGVDSRDRRRATAASFVYPVGDADHGR